MTESMAEQLAAGQAMFVQKAHGSANKDGTLTLTGVSPSTLYFADRPQRVVGHMGTQDFVELWGEGDNSFESDPPNAVLAFVEPGDGVPEDPVVGIKDPQVSRRGPSFPIELLEGAVP